MVSAVSKAESSVAAQPPWAALLDLFYARAGLRPPTLRPLDGEHVPQPYRALLVHSHDMTPTLEAFYRQPIALKVLGHESQDESYLREVILERTDRPEPVEYGVIRICLNHLPPAAARRVLEAQTPFGTILHDEAVPHMSWPQAFFSVESDSRIATLLGLAGPSLLYGRRNVLLNRSRRLLAEVLEILAPPPARKDLKSGGERCGRT